MESKALYLFFEMQGFFFGVILGIDGGIASRGGKPMDYKDVTAFLGYLFLTVYYLMHLLKH